MYASCRPVPPAPHDMNLLEQLARHVPDAAPQMRTRIIAVRRALLDATPFPAVLVNDITMIVMHAELDDGYHIICYYNQLIHMNWNNWEFNLNATRQFWIQVKNYWNQMQPVIIQNALQYQFYDQLVSLRQQFHYMQVRLHREIYMRYPIENFYMVHAQGWPYL